MPTGWSDRYEFTEADAIHALDVIDSLINGACGKRQNLDPEKLPWEAIRATLCKGVFGGRITNDEDQEILDNLVNKVFVPKAFDVDFLLQVQGNVQTLEDENSNLRQRVRALELEISEAAFESRKVMPAPIAAVAPTSTLTSGMEASVVIANTAKLSPKAPSVPVPPHILQQQLGQLHMQSAEYKRERSSALNTVGRGLRNGLNKVGRALNMWNPAYNLMLWGELKGH